MWAGDFSFRDNGRAWGNGLVGRGTGPVFLSFESSSDPVVAFTLDENNEDGDMEEGVPPGTIIKE